MRQLTIPSAAKIIGVSEEAINRLIRPKREEENWKNLTFFISIKKNTYKVKVIDGIPFIKIK